MDSKISVYISQIKDQLNLKDFVSSLGYEVGSDGKMCCPFHHEKTPSCVVSQSNFKCFGGSCGLYGDFADFYQKLNPGAHLVEAVNVAADLVGMPPLLAGDFNDESVKLAIIQRKQIRDLGGVYEDACAFFERRILSSPEVLKFTKRKWGFGEDFIKKWRVGYAPRGCSEQLVAHLKSNGHDDSIILKTGLFYSNDVTGRPSFAFGDRIMFPYIIGRGVKYFIGRLPRPDSEDYDLYEKHRSKYKKLLVHNAKHPYVAECVQNKYLFGEDNLYDSNVREIWITEGITDAMLGQEAGASVVSPVTTRLRRQDIDKYVKYFKAKEVIYIANDNEENQSGEKGAMATADHLERNGCNVRIVSIPRPTDGSVDKVDLNDYLRTSSDISVALNHLKVNAQTPLIKLITDLDPNCDEIERTNQIFHLESYWARVRPADIPTYMKRVKDHFGMNREQSNALMKDINKLVKDKNNKPDKKDDSMVDKTNWTLKEHVDCMMAEGGNPRIANDIADSTFEWLQKKDAKFYCNPSEDLSVIFYRGKLYPYKSPQFRTLMYELTELTKEQTLGRQVFDCLHQKVLMTGEHIDSLTWIHTTNKGLKYMSLSGDESSQIICLDPNARAPYLVSNGNNKDNVVLRVPYGSQSFNYDPNVTIEESLALIDELIFQNMTCDVQDRYLILSWMMLGFFVDKIGTRPHLRLEGNAGSGKTTTAKMLTCLMFGEERHQNASTLAAIYDMSSTSPIICVDNFENHNLTDKWMDFIIATATRATRTKKGSADAGDMVEQSPQCLIMTTGIESLSKHELIQRSLIIGFDEANSRPDFMEAYTLEKIRQNRDKMLSGLIKLAHRILKSKMHYQRWQKIAGFIKVSFPVNPKHRNIEALCVMALAVRHISRHIKEDFEYTVIKDTFSSYRVPVKVGDNQHAYKDIFASWIHTQADSDMSVNSGTNPILFFLEMLKKRHDSEVIESNLFTREYGVEAKSINGMFCVIFTPSELHYAFSRLANHSIKYNYDTPAQLSKRMRDSIKVLNNSGWMMGWNARRTSRNRYHVIAKTMTEDEMEKLQSEFPLARWN